jgi:hypothetical protein
MNRAGRPRGTGERTSIAPDASNVSFPGAGAQTLADAPARCPCGADWLTEHGGLACRMCGRRLYVVSELRRLVERYGFGGVPASLPDRRLDYGARRSSIPES